MTTKPTQIGAPKELAAYTDIIVRVIQHRLDFIYEKTTVRDLNFHGFNINPSCEMCSEAPFYKFRYSLATIRNAANPKILFGGQREVLL